MAASTNLYVKSQATFALTLSVHQLPIASITKLMTFLCVLTAGSEMEDLSMALTVSKRAALAKGTRAKLKECSQVVLRCTSTGSIAHPGISGFNDKREFCIMVI